MQTHEPWLKISSKENWQYCEFKAKQTVCILPFYTFPKTKSIQKPYTDISILGRYEYVPCHNNKGHHYEGDTGPVLSSFTGTMHPGELPYETALRELREEAGYIIDQSRLIDLGYCYPSKATDQIVYLFAANVERHTAHPLIKDGSDREETAKNSWIISELFLKETNCPIVGLAFSRLLFTLN